MKLEMTVTYERRMRRELARIISEVCVSREYTERPLHESVHEIAERAFRAGNLAPRPAVATCNIREKLRRECRAILALAPIAAERNPELPLEAIISTAEHILEEIK
jgi:hypothetical protein